MTTTILTADQIESEFIEHGWSFGGKAEMYIEVARAIEQAALQSPEVQAWKRDAERLDWLADPNNSIGNVQLPTECVTENLHSLRAAIDAAMEKQA